MGEVASEGCSPSLWAGAESPVAGAVRLARSKLDNLRYLSGTESQRTFQIIYLESEEKQPKSGCHPSRFLEPRLPCHTT